MTSKYFDNNNKEGNLDKWGFDSDIKKNQKIRRRNFGKEGIN